MLGRFHHSDKENFHKDSERRKQIWGNLENGINLLILEQRVDGLRSRNVNKIPIKYVEINEFGSIQSFFLGFATTL